MSSIGGPSGIGGPKGPSGPTGPDDIGDVSDTADVAEGGAVRDGRAIDAAAAARAVGELQGIAADIAAGKLTAREAVDRLVDEIAGNDQLGATARAELRELLTDLIENDPYLSSLSGRA